MYPSSPSRLRLALEIEVYLRNLKDVQRLFYTLFFNTKQLITTKLAFWATLSLQGFSLPNSGLFFDICVYIVHVCSSIQKRKMALGVNNVLSMLFHQFCLYLLYLPRFIFSCASDLLQFFIVFAQNSKVIWLIVSTKTNRSGLKFKWM